MSNLFNLFASFGASQISDMLRKYVVILFMLIGVTQFNGIAQNTNYTISFPNAPAHYIHVDAKFSSISSDSIDIKMPVWTPGSYMVREYSRNVESFRAFDANGKALKVEKTRKNAWRVHHGKSNEVKISYDVYAFELNVRSCFVDQDQVYINGVGLFMYTESLKYKPYEVTFQPRAEWKVISTGLPVKENNPWVRTTTDYDQLVDAPVVIGNHEVFTFDYKGIPHHIAMIGEAKYDREKIKKDFYKIVDETNKIFGDNPNKEYTFIIHNTLNGGGGLEHYNSCSIMTARSNYENNKKGYDGLLSLAAHEYFHQWIVKRVRPMELGPFDYDNEVYTRQLWFFEGFTSYYDDYIVYRAGFTNESEYLETVKSNIQTLRNTPGNLVQPVSESSFDAWIKYYRKNENSNNSIVSYYTKGSMLAAILNLDIIQYTNGRKTLDTLMNHLYQQHYKKLNRGLTDAELQNYIELIGEKDYDNFFAKYIDGTDEVPYEDYFQLSGLMLNRVDGKRQATGYLGATISTSGEKYFVSFVERNSPAWTTGLSVNDEITAIDDLPAAKIIEYLKEKEPGTSVKIKLLRMGLPKEISITLGEPVEKEYVWEYIKKPTEQQKLVKSIWLR